jgi:beta-galactosidase/beta-glucuronidase
MKSDDKKLVLTEWQFQLDVNDLGESRGWYLPEYDRSQWMEVNVPGPWDFYEHSLRHYEGVGWYSAKIRVCNNTNTRHLLEFEGIGGRAWVWVNGEPAGYNGIRYLPFIVNISKYLNGNGENTIVVKVDNRFQGDEHLTGGKRIEWVLYGGLTHNVNLVEVPACRIEHVETKADASGKVYATITVYNESGHEFIGKINLTLDTAPKCEGQSEVRCAAGERIKISLNLKAQFFNLWSLDNPVLYKVTAILLTDNAQIHKTVVRVGFRTIKCVGTRIILNDEPILIKGVNRYDEYHPYGTSVPGHLIREDLEHIKKCGANLVRVHYPQHPVHLEIADEIGLLYMLEVPLNWWYPEDDTKLEDYPSLVAEATEIMDRTYDVFCNHPSWAIWSMSNESIYRNDAGIGMVRMLAERAKKMECGRLVTNVINYMPQGKELDFCDLMCLNRYHAAYQPVNKLSELEELIAEPTRKDLARIAECYPDKPIIMSEFGSTSIRGIRGEVLKSENFHGEYIRYAYRIIMECKNVCGTILWTWADYFHNIHVYQKNDEYNYMKEPFGPYGVVTVDRKIKGDAYRALVEVYSGRRL